MKQSEFVQSNDKSVWIDVTTTEEHIRKITIMPISHHYDFVEEVLNELPIKLETRARSLAINIVQEIFRVGCSSRRAWVHGHDVAYESHVNKIAPILTNMIDGSIEVTPEQQEAIIGKVKRARGRKPTKTMVSLRDLVRYELDKPENEKLQARIYSVVSAILEDLYKYMSPNTYVMHEINFGQNPRRLAIYELDDWRAIQWTKNQIEKKRQENNDN